MRNTYKIFLGVIVAGFLVFLIPAKSASANCTPNVQVTPPSGNLPFNQSLTVNSKITLGNFVQSGSCDGYCSSTKVACFKKFFVYYGYGYPSAGVWGPDMSTSPTTGIIGGKKTEGGSGWTTDTINMAPNRGPPYDSKSTIIPSDLGYKAGDTVAVNVYVVACNDSSSFFSYNCEILTASGIKNINLAAGVYNVFACVAGGNYACSAPGKNYSDCSGIDNKASVCGTDPNNCVRIDSNLCGKPAQNTHKACLNNSCSVVPGPPPDSCTTSPDSCAAGGGGGGGGGGGYNFTLEPPSGFPQTFQELVNIIGVWIFNLAIPIAVIIIIYAGILMLTSGGDKTRFSKGTAALKWAVIGLAVVLIGKGFVSLITSILSLKNP